MSAILEATRPTTLLTAADLAREFHVTLSTVRSWRLKGLEGKPGYGPVGFTVGRRVLYRRSDVDACIATNSGTR